MHHKRTDWLLVSQTRPRLRPIGKCIVTYDKKVRRVVGSTPTGWGGSGMHR